MGGGDLNLKKSWHPHTMKNQEKVWKAEQAKSQEENKLKDLRREIEEEKSREELKRIGRDSGVLGGSHEGDKKLDWMYKNSTDLINRDEYLLGRKIDKSFEILQAEERHKEQQNLVGVKQPINHVEHECVPFSIRSYKNLQNSDQVDLQRKVMEDPLMLIKQREMESRRKILENPVKLKELHRILKTDEKLQKVSKKSNKSKKSKKSKKKHKKHSKSSSSSSSDSENDSDSDLDSKLAKKLKGGLIDKEDALSMGINLSKLLDSKYDKISQELDKAAGKSSKHSKSKYNPTSNVDNSSEDERNAGVRQYSQSISNNRQYDRQPIHYSRRSRSVSKDRFKTHKRYQEKRSRSPEERNYGEKKKPFFNPFKRSSRSLSRLRDDKGGFQRNQAKPRANYSNISMSRSRDDKSQPNRYRNTTRSHSRDRKRYIRPKSRSPYRPRDINKHTRSRSRSNNRIQNPFNRSPPRDFKIRNIPTSRSPYRSRDNRRPNERVSRSNSKPSYGTKTEKYISKSPQSRDNRRLYKRNSRSRSRSPKRYTRSPMKTSYRKLSPKPSGSSKLRTSKLSDDEKQAKLREMMSNAAWREEERTEVVRKHREEYAREERHHSARDFDKDFLNKEVKKAMANQTSVGSRLRANLNNIQRTSAAMNSNFARK